MSVRTLAVRVVVAGVAYLGWGPQVAQAQDSGYWQQEVQYTIEASLDEAAQVLHGVARVRYVNRSPETLDALYFHQYLNAFRPASAWSDVEQRANLDFNALSDPDYGYERLTHASVAGNDVQVSYPGAPDSVVVKIDLPAPLAPGGEVIVDLAWDARPSTLCRRQCRAGRHYDFAQWYPRIATYDQFGWQAHTLLPQGEFYGEYATYDVTIELADDQVIGATGVPVTGDPGWSPSPWSPSSEIDYQRDWYGDLEAPESVGLLDGAAAAGRKRIRWHAEDVHHFAMTLSPDYRYETGKYRDVSIHVLYKPADISWDAGAAVARTARTLEWLEGAMGDYPYPQLTNVHRLEGGGTEFPMMIMDGTSGQGLITHEGAHQYVHGILGNNEWKEAWLDEGMASFLTSWFTQDITGDPNPWAGTIEGLARFEASNDMYSMSLAAEAYPDFRTYGTMAYSRPSAMLFMLRELVGTSVMRDVMREYFRRHRFQHVTSADFEKSVADVTGEDFTWFFDLWLRSTDHVDYGVQSVEVEALGDGTYRSTVTVVRLGRGWMPVTLEVGGVRKQLTSRETTQVVVIESETAPTQAVLDPDVILLDSDRANNVFSIGR